MARAHHLQLAPFGFGVSGQLPESVADRSADAAPLRRFLHGRIDRGSVQPRFSRGARQFSALLCRREPRALRARSADVRRPAAELRQHPIDAGGGRARHHSARRRRRSGDLPGPAQRRGGTAAHRDAVQALPSGTAAADQPRASAFRHGRDRRLPFDAVGRRLPRRAAPARHRDRRPLWHELRSRCCPTSSRT